MPIPFNQESWVWYTVAMVLISSRVISRFILFRSLKSFKFDDWLMGGFVTLCYTMLVVISNKWLKARSNLEPLGFDFSALSDSELAFRRHGSKLMIGVEQLLIIVIWSCKACLLVMYYRITRTALRNENRAIKYLSIYVATSFVFMEVLYFGVWCRPFSGYYAVPVHSRQCNTLVDHRIIKAVFNISSDVIMLGIALQMLIRSLLPMKRKLILCAIFSLGIFVVIASIASTYYSIKYPYRQEWIAWYIREASTAVLVANLPFTWTILKNLFELDDFYVNNPAPWTYHPAGRNPIKNINSVYAPGTMNQSRISNKYKSPYSTIQSRGANPVVITGEKSLETYNRFSMKTTSSAGDEKALLAEEISIASSNPILTPSITDLEHGFPDPSPVRSTSGDKNVISIEAHHFQIPSPVHLSPMNSDPHML